MRLKYYDGKYGINKRNAEWRELLRNRMHKKVKHIEIVLENCEVFNVLASSIRYMYFDIDIKSGRIDNICKREFADYSDYESAEFFKLILTNIDRVIGTEIFSSNFTDRVKTNGDITQIHITFDDDSTYWFYVPWDYASEYHNSYQYVQYKNDKMYIYIGKEKPEDLND